MKQTRIFILLFLLVAVHVAKAQITFQKTYGTFGNETGMSIHQSNDLGYIISGIANDQLMFALKINQNGDTLWTKKFFAALWSASIQTSDGGFAFSGYSSDQVLGCNDFRLIKTDVNGTTQWNHLYFATKDAMNISVIQTQDGGYLLAGTSDSIATLPLQNYDMKLVKTDANGAFEWSKSYGSTAMSANEEIASVIQSNDGGYLLMGRKFDIASSNWDALLIKTDTLGNVSWSKTYGGVASEAGNSIQQTADGGYIIAGGSTGFGAGAVDMYLVKTDALGNELWSKTVGGIGNDVANGVAQTADGGYVALGQTTSFGAGSVDVYLVKLDNSGALVWSKTFGGANDDRGYAMALTQDGGTVITGYNSSTGTGGFDIYVIKTDVNGNSNCNETSPVSISSTVATVTNSPLTLQRSWGGLGNDMPFTFPIANPPLNTTTACTSVSIVPLTGDAAEVEIKPNPCSEWTTVTLSNFDFTVKSKVQLTDIFGKVIRDFEFNGETFNIEREHLKSGIYFLKISNEEQKSILIKKIIFL